MPKIIPNKHQNKYQIVAANLEKTIPKRNKLLIISAVFIPKSDEIMKKIPKIITVFDFFMSFYCYSSLRKASFISCLNASIFM